MILKALNSNKASALILAPIIAFAAYAYGYYKQLPQIAAFQEDGMPLWNYVSSLYVGHTQWLFPSGFILAILIAIIINKMTNEYLLFGKPTFLPAVLFIVLCSGFVSIQILNPVWIFALFFILSLDNFFASTLHHNPAENCFNGALLYSIGSLFYGKALLLAPVIWFIMIGLRSANVRSFLASILGFGLPYLILFFIPIQLSQQKDLYDLIVFNMTVPMKMISYSIPFYIYVGVLMSIITLSLVSVLGKYSSKKIITRNFYKIFLISVLFLFALTLTRIFSIEIIPVLAIGSSFLLTHLFNNIRSPKVSSALLYLLLISTSLAQYYFANYPN